MVEATFESGPGGGLFWGDGLNGEETAADVELRISNAGSTPAWVYEQYVYLMVTPEVIMSMNEYPTPKFPYPKEGMVGHENYQISPLAPGQAPIKWKALVKDKGKSTVENGMYAYIFGVIRYRDAFDSSRETYFGYTVKANKRLERIPNEAYNKHT